MVPLAHVLSGRHLHSIGRHAVIGPQLCFYLRFTLLPVLQSQPHLGSLPFSCNHIDAYSVTDPGPVSPGYDYLKYYPTADAVVPPNSRCTFRFQIQWPPDPIHRAQALLPCSQIERARKQSSSSTCCLSFKIS
jgi:hypothetical protein